MAKQLCERLHDCGSSDLSLTVWLLNKLLTEYSFYFDKCPTAKKYHSDPPWSCSFCNAFYREALPRFLNLSSPKRYNSPTYLSSAKRFYLLFIATKNMTVPGGGQMPNRRIRWRSTYNHILKNSSIKIIVKKLYTNAARTRNRNKSNRFAEESFVRIWNKWTGPLRRRAQWGGWKIAVGSVLLQKTKVIFGEVLFLIKLLLRFKSYSLPRHVCRLAQSGFFLINAS